MFYKTFATCTLLTILTPMVKSVPTTPILIAGSPYTECPTGLSCAGNFLGNQEFKLANQGYHLTKFKYWGIVD